MRTALCLLALLGLTATAVDPARAGFIQSDGVFVQVLRDDTSFLTSFNLSAPVSEPAGAGDVTISGLFETSDPGTPSLLVGDIIVNETRSGPLFPELNYLEGAMTDGVFDFADPENATSFVLSFLPTGGNEAGTFSPAFIGTISDLTLIDLGGGFFEGAGNLSISQVPAPPALALLLPGLAALGLMARRRAAQPSS